MKAAIIGYGKMGREIERILAERGHETALVIDTDNVSELDAAHLAGIDVAIEFTTPQTAYDNIRTCLEAGTAVVSGTTGWTDRLPELEELCRRRDGAMFYASNYCLGVNLLFRLNRELAAMIERLGAAYDVRIEEIHHTQKKDAPSGTAITLAEGVIAGMPDKREWVNYAPGIDCSAHRIDDPAAAASNQVVIGSVREGAVPGIHTVRYESEDDCPRAAPRDQEPPLAGAGRRRGGRVPRGQAGHLHDGRPAQITRRWKRSKRSCATNGSASRWRRSSIRSGSWYGPATSGCCWVSR